MIGAVVLAAGRGERLGGVAKALLRMPDGGDTFLARIAATGRAAGVDAWLIVTAPPHGTRVSAEAERLGLAWRENPQPERGMASSVAIGFAAAIGAFSGCEAAFLWPVDHPRVTACSLAALIAAGRADGAAIPRHEGRGGHPPLVGRALWPELAGCDRVAAGARNVLGARPERVTYVEVDDPGVIADVDTPRDLP